MIELIIGCLVYLLGFFLSYQMSVIEIHADKETFTKGDKLLTIFLSLLSFVWVLIILIITWVKRISATGYWNTPVKPIDAVSTTNEPSKTA